MLIYRGNGRTLAVFGFARPSALKPLLGALALAWAATTGSTAEPQSAVTQPAEPSLEALMKMEIPVVEAASKYQQKTTEAPASVTIITADEVKKYGYRTLADILASAPGLYTTYDRNYSYLGVRGFSVEDPYTQNSRVLVLVDGHRINNNLTDGAAIGTDFILDVGLIDRVEVIRGPGSSLYGNNAFLGVINVITRKGRDMAGHGVEVSGEAGSFDTYKGRVTYGNQFKNGLEVLFSGTIYDSGGQSSLYYPAYDQRIVPPPPPTRIPWALNNGIAENADSDSFKSAFGSVAFHDFSLEGGYITRGKGNPTASPYPTDFNDNRLRTTDDRGYANLKFAHEFPEDLNLTAQLYYDLFEHKIDQPQTYNTPGDYLQGEVQQGEWWGTDVQLIKRLWDRHTVTLGGEYRDDFKQEDSIYSNNANVPAQAPISTNRQNYAIFLQGDFAVLTNLHFNAGVRYDQYGDYNPSINPRLALIYNPVGQAVLKAIYGTAFRAPNFFEATYWDTNTPTLKPETITTYELVYEQGIGNHLRSSVAGFYNQIDDLISLGNVGYQNVSSAEAKGVELSLDAFWSSGVRGRTSYTFQESQNSSTGEVLTDSPRNVAKLNLSVPLWKDKIFAGVEFQYLSARTTIQTDPLTGATETGVAAGGYGVVNFTLFSQNLVKGLDISASVYNLLDQSYSDPSTPQHVQNVIPQNGRSFRVKLTYRF
jgi:outer membrane receptor for ferrienterochelin and colicins